MSERICLKYFLSCKQVECKYSYVLIIDCFGLVVFAVDFVVSRIMSQLFTCVLLICTLTCYRLSIECLIGLDVTQYGWQEVESKNCC